VTTPNTTGQTSSSVSTKPDPMLTSLLWRASNKYERFGLVTNGSYTSSARSKQKCPNHLVRKLWVLTSASITSLHLPTKTVTANCTR
jgi:hypothetical protein